MKHYVVYARSAVYNEIVIARQCRNAQEWICFHDPDSRIQFYADNGCSGITLIRPELKRLLHDILQGNVHSLIIEDWARLSRKDSDLELLVELFHSLNIPILVSSLHRFYASLPVTMKKETDHRRKTP